MADPPPTRLHIDPPMDQWRVTPRNGRAKPVIATGHQPTLWHPGILAKYLAADALAEHVGGSTLNAVVEHNPLGPLAVDVPIQIDETLSVFSVKLDRRPGADTTPPNRLGPINGGSMLGSITEAAYRSLDVKGASRVLEDKLACIGESLADAQDQVSLAMQVSDALGRLFQPFVRWPIPSLPTSRLVTPSFVERLLADPLGCVRSYNRAAGVYPDAGIRTLYAGRDVAEAPLWAQGGGRCTPVFVDLGDSGKPYLFTQGQPLDLTGPDALACLRPRAVTLSAVMRSEHCDLFIHGKGGGNYDQVTERWWKDWTGEDLAPKAVVSADVYLPFDVPVTTPQQRDRAQWYAHHLPHNIDRYSRAGGEYEAAMITEKRRLLDQMNDDRDKRRRARAFQRVHAINTELRGQHQGLIREAAQRANDARIGVSNAAIAGRRDWCFALYPGDEIRQLKQRLVESLKSSG